MTSTTLAGSLHFKSPFRCSFHPHTTIPWSYPVPAQIWTLTDTASDIHHTEFRITDADLPGTDGNWSVTKRVLRGGLSDGVDLIEVDNGQMTLAIIPTRGMGIWRAKIGDDVLGWRSPVRGPVHPKYVPNTDPNGFGWLEGFDELVVRCGLESNGGPDFDDAGRLAYPLHGRIANRPAHRVEVIVDDGAGRITVRGVVEETRFHFQKLRLTAEISTAFGSTSFAIHDQVENFGGSPAEMQMLYHINFGEPLLGEGAKIVAPVRAVAPFDAEAAANVSNWDTFGPPVPGAAEQCFAFELASDSSGWSQVLLKNAESAAGAVVRYRAENLPHFTVWKNMVASEDGYVTGLEPATNFPNPRSFETKQGRVVELGPGDTWSADVAVDWLRSAGEVASAEETVRSLQGNVEPTIHPQPKAEWSASAKNA